MILRGQKRLNVLFDLIKRVRGSISDVMVWRVEQSARVTSCRRDRLIIFVRISSF